MIDSFLARLEEDGNEVPCRMNKSPQRKQHSSKSIGDQKKGKHDEHKKGQIKSSQWSSYETNPDIVLDSKRQFFNSLYLKKTGTK